MPEKEDPEGAIQENEEDGEDWKVLLKEAEELLETGKAKEALPILVKVARLNADSDRAFYLLGRTVQAKNPTKAKGCLERAVKLAPTNADYVRELDDLLAKQGTITVTAALRLPNLVALSKHHKAEWLNERMAKLYLATKDYKKAIEELQHLTRRRPDCMQTWAQLAYAYQHNGHLKAAADSYQKILETNPDSHHAVSMIRVLMLLKEYERSLAMCLEWKVRNGHTEKAQIVIELLEIQIRTKLLATANTSEEKKEYLRSIFRLLSALLVKRPPYVLAYKLAGDALYAASFFSDAVIRSLEICPDWNVSDRLSASKQSAHYYLYALRISGEAVLSWYDLALALMRQYNLNGDKQMAEKAVLCLKTAIGMSKDKAEKSQLWTSLFDALRYADRPKAMLHHCLVRALQLNKKNSNALLRLAVFYFDNNRSQSHQAFERALTFDPENYAAWCGWATHARSHNQPSEAETLSRRSLTINPIPMAIQLFTHYTLHKIHSGIPFNMTTGLADFPAILAIKDLMEPDDPALLHLGILADLHGYYEEADELLATLDHDPKAAFHLMRVRTKLGHDLAKQPLKGLGKLWRWSALPVADLQYELTLKRQEYPAIYDALATGESENLKELFAANYKKVSMPLIVTEIIIYQRPLSDACVRILHDLVPRHELIDFFPTTLPASIDNGLRYVEKDEAEKPFRYSHKFAHKLAEMLAQRRKTIQEPDEPAAYDSSDVETEA